MGPESGFQEWSKEWVPRVVPGSGSMQGVVSGVGPRSGSKEWVQGVVQGVVSGVGPIGVLFCVYHFIYIVVDRLLSIQMVHRPLSWVILVRPSQSPNRCQ